MAMVQIPEWAAKLAAVFLKEYKQRLSDDGSNDYDVPDDVPRAELEAAIREWNGPTDDDPDSAARLCGFNWAVVGAVGSVIEQATKARA